MEPSEAPKFEESLTELQQIIAQLEGERSLWSGRWPSSSGGVGLLRTCYRVLEEAEQKIELLVGFDPEGQPLTEPFDATATYDAAEQKAGRRRAGKSSSVSPPADSAVGRDRLFDAVLRNSRGKLLDVMNKTLERFSSGGR